MTSKRRTTMNYRKPEVDTLDDAITVIEICRAKAAGAALRSRQIRVATSIRLR